MKSNNPNRKLTAGVARAFGPLLDRVAFVGGCATGLLLTDAAAPSVRATDDVDVVAAVATYAVEYADFAEELRKRGFCEDSRENAPLCRWVIQGMVVDVMPADPSVLGFSNRWYPLTLETAVNFEIEPGLVIRLTSAPCFLATKLEAYRNRGGGDFLESTDLDDIIAVADGRPELVDEVQIAPPELRSFLSSQMRSLINDPDFDESIAGHLPPDAANQARRPIIRRRLAAIGEIE